MNIKGTVALDFQRFLIQAYAPRATQNLESILVPEHN